MSERSPIAIKILNFEIAREELGTVLRRPIGLIPVNHILKHQQKIDAGLKRISQKRPHSG